MRKNDLQDPELAQFRHRSAPIPRTAIFGGEGAAVQTSLRRAKSRRDLDSGSLPAPRKNSLRWGNRSSVSRYRRTPVPPVGRPCALKWRFSRK
jgi:hypothetical protein